MSNPNRSDDGRNAFTEEVLGLVPDCLEAADRLDAIQDSLVKHLANFEAGVRVCREAINGMRVDLQQLREEVRDDRAELERRLIATRDAAERAGYPFLGLPTFRVIAGAAPETIA